MEFITKYDNIINGGRKMALVKNNITETIATSHNLLMNCVNNETFVGIHQHGKDSIVRTTAIISDFSLKINELYLNGEQIEILINKDIIDIQYIKEENSIYILFEDREIYLDLC